MPLLTILLSDLAGNEIAEGSGMATFMRTLGGSFAISITTYLWNHRAIVHHAQLAEQFTPTSPTTQKVIQGMGGGNVQSAMAQLEMLINRQAFQIAFNEIFLALAVTLTAMIVLIWFAKPPFFKTTASPAAPPVEH